jgi:hypothetical protein
MTMKKWLTLGVLSVLMVSVWGVLLSFMFSSDSASNSEAIEEADEALEMPSYGVVEDDEIIVEEIEKDEVTTIEDSAEESNDVIDEWNFTGKSVSTVDVTVREGDGIGYGKGVPIDELLEGFSISK